MIVNSLSADDRAAMRKTCEAEMRRKVITHRDRWLKTDPVVILAMLDELASQAAELERLRAQVEEGRRFLAPLLRED